MAAQIQTGSTYNLVQYSFTAQNVGNADGTLAFSADSDYAPVVYGGSIVGAALYLNGTLTTGTLTPRPTINGSLCPPFSGTLTISQSSMYVQQESHLSNYQFNAGDYIGLMWNKAGTIAPTTRDAVAVLTVLYQEVRY